MLEEWGNHFFGKLTHANLDEKAEEARADIDVQINYAAHLGVRGVMLELPKTSRGVATLGNVLTEKINTDGGLPSIPQVWILIDLRMYDNLTSSDDEQKSSASDVRNHQLPDPWKKWNQLRRMLLPSRRVGVVLHCGLNALPDDVAQRWAGEPIRAVMIGTKCFLTNKRSFPVLSKHHQSFITMIRDQTAYEAHLIVANEHTTADYNLYSQYLNYLCTKTNLSDATAHYARGFEDVLQLPLQPLMDNLESHTYEIFEKDPVKYEQYRKAIAAAMSSLSSETLVVMVVGAGRGPLVHAALQAASETGKVIQVYAVEKNSNAVHTLKHLLKSRWGGIEGLAHGKVQVIASDMRDWTAPELADIVVSELLGSFGDNELSPECLDGVYRLCRPDTISIPQSYTSYIAPIMSHKLHLETFVNLPYDKPSYFAFECTYVAYLRNFYMIDSPKQLFTFDHSNLSLAPETRDNRRHELTTFTARSDCCLHGFAGFFDAKLFGDVHISIVPGQESPDMFSWFPLWIPIKTPIDLSDGQQIQLAVWRRLNKHKVWYEWAVMEPTTTDIHNSNGRSQSIGL
jgi:protein arginine N-methyltransferase 5